MDIVNGIYINLFFIIKNLQSETYYVRTLSKSDKIINEIDNEKKKKPKKKYNIYFFFCIN